MYFFCQLCNYALLTERAEPWKLVADTRVTGSKDLVASSSASGGNNWLENAVRNGQIDIHGGKNVNVCWCDLLLTLPMTAYVASQTHC